MAKLGDPIRCEGTRKGKDCGGHVFKCSNAECASRGCEKSGCSERQFMPIQRCKDCGRTYERIQQFGPSAAPRDPGAGSGVVGRPIALPNVEILFGAILGLVILGVAIASTTGLFATRPLASAAGPALPEISVSGPAGTRIAYTEICQCYRDGMALAGTGVSVLHSTYRVGFVQCRAAFGPQGGDAWTAGWNARVGGKLVGAGCRSWARGFGQ